ncbi:MAG: hypothetical protein ABI467_18295 [Kofleriaceae bacterium]
MLVVELILLAGCGDNKPSTNIDGPAIRDARVDAPTDAPLGTCLASDQCTDPAQPVCCMIVHAGGEAQRMCGQASSGNTSCPYVACRGSADPCHTLTGATGTCTSQPFGPTQMPYWVCL